MPIIPDLARGYFAYKSDNGQTYQLATSIGNGSTAQGASPLAPGVNPAFPRGWKPRIVYGLSTDGTTRTKVPILDPGDGLWTGATVSFSKDGLTFIVEGKRGEDRFNRGG